MKHKHGEKYYGNKNNIIECFLDLITNEGYHSTTINKLSKKVGLSYGSITNIFPTKEDILLELLKRTIGIYEEKSISSGNRLKTFLSNLVLQMKKTEDDDNIRDLLLEQFTLYKTTEFLKEYIVKVLSEALGRRDDCYFKATAIIGIIREYINTNTNIYFSFDRKCLELVKAVLLICEYKEEDINIMLGEIV